MKALDTNVLARYLVGDDAAMTTTVTEALEEVHLEFKLNRATLCMHRLLSLCGIKSSIHNNSIPESSLSIPTTVKFPG